MIDTQKSGPMTQLALAGKLFVVTAEAVLPAWVIQSSPVLAQSSRSEGFNSPQQELQFEKFAEKLVNDSESFKEAVRILSQEKYRSGITAYQTFAKGEFEPHTSNFPEVVSAMPDRIQVRFMRSSTKLEMQFGFIYEKNDGKVLYISRQMK